MVSVIIAAAGRGERLSRTAQELGMSEYSLPKQFCSIGGQPVLYRTMKVFDNVDAVDEIIVVLSNEGFGIYGQIMQDYTFNKPIRLVQGGVTRQESILCGLRVADPTGVVLIHDAARPFIKRETVLNCIAAVDKYGSAVVVVPLKDTVKLVDGEGHIISTPVRSSMRAAQTPQCFRTAEILHYHELAIADGFSSTDDSSVAEHYGVKPYCVEGEAVNIKLTTAEDLFAAEYFAAMFDKENENAI